jgi:hypothetical protein
MSCPTIRRRSWYCGYKSISTMRRILWEKVIPKSYLCFLGPSKSLAGRCGAVGIRHVELKWSWCCTVDVYEQIEMKKSRSRKLGNHKVIRVWEAQERQRRAAFKGESSGQMVEAKVRK